MSYPTRYTVGWHTATTAQTGRGTTTTYAPLLTATGTQVKVIGWAPTRQAETTETRVESDIDLFVPPGVSSTAGDVVDLPSGRFEVVAYPEDWSFGPFGFQPGAVVKLKRVQG